MKLFIKETRVDATNGCIFHEGRLEPSDFSTLSELYKHLRDSMRGRIQKMYIDTKSGKTVHVGYTVSFENVSDDGSKYTEEVWIELLEPIEVVETVTRYKPVGT